MEHTLRDLQVLTSPAVLGYPLRGLHHSWQQGVSTELWSETICPSHLVTRNHLLPKVGREFLVDDTSLLDTACEVDRSVSEAPFLTSEPGIHRTSQESTVRGTRFGHHCTEMNEQSAPTLVAHGT